MFAIERSRLAPVQPSMKTQALRERAARWWKKEIRPLLILALVLFAVRSSLADWNDVPSGSMRPTIIEGDRIFVNKLAYDLKVPFTTWHIAEWSNPQRGDIAVFFSPHDGQRLVKRNRTFSNALGQGLAFQALHHHEAGTFVTADVEQHADVRMVQRSNHAGLALEPLLQIGPPGGMLREDLNRNEPFQARVTGLPYLTHSSSTKRAQDFVGAQSFACGQRHCVEVSLSHRPGSRILEAQRRICSVGPFSGLSV